jgi:hypothetical protein
MEEETPDIKELISQLENLTIDEYVFVPLVDVTYEYREPMKYFLFIFSATLSLTTLSSVASPSACWQ